jgi:DNA mismatch endonuclease (patch repair protein)
VWECQLKPKVREQTLESLAFTLNHIFLMDRKVVKPYSLEENEDTLMAAEPSMNQSFDEK